MKVLVKIELIILFLLCSIVIYLDYSFNSANILMEGNTQIDYVFNDSINNDDVIKTINTVANKNDVYIYYNSNGHNKNFYVSDNFKLDTPYMTNTPENGSKNIYLPSSYRIINIFPLNDDEKIVLERGSLILEGEYNNVQNAITDLSEYGMDVINTNIVTREKSYYYLDFLPLFFFLILLICITVSFDLLVKNKKISIMLLEGYSRLEIIVHNLKSYLFILPYSIGICIIFNLIIHYFKNSNFTLMYTSIFICFTILIISIIILLNIILIRKFDITRLKNMINVNAPIFLLYLFKIACITTILITSANISLLYNKLNYQQKQLNYSNQLEDYYGYDMTDDGFFSLNEDLKQSPYTSLYTSTFSNNSGLLIDSIACSIDDNECANNDANFIASPQYIHDYVDNDYNTSSDTITIFTTEENSISSEEIYNLYRIDKDIDVDIMYITQTEIPVINSSYEIQQNEFNSIIVLNSTLIQSSTAIEENMSYLMQHYLLKLSSDDPYSELSKLLERLNLQEQITNVKNINDVKYSYVVSIISKMKINILIIVTHNVKYLNLFDEIIDLSNKNH